MLFRIRKYPEAERRLNESLTLDPKQGFANATMGMLKIKQNKYSEAKDYLQKAVSSGETNYRIYYQYAYILSHEGRAKGSVMDKFSSVTADEMRNALKKAISLNPSFPRSYDLMARVSLITGENIDEGIEYLLKAIKLSPGNQFYRLNLANLYLRKREISKAIPIVETVHKTADEPQLRSYAARLLEDLKRIKNQIERFKNQGNIDRDDERSVSRTRERDNSRPPRLGRRTRPNVATDRKSAMTDGKRGTLALNRALREVQDGEERFLGYLSGISCKNGGVVYLVKRDNNMLLLRSKDFQKLELTMINVDLGNLEIGCGSIKKDMLAVITYRPNGKPKTKVVGEMISIEFVPANFKIMKVEER